MRVFFKPGSTLYPKGGKRDDVVYCYHNDGMFCFTRKYYIVPEMPQHVKIKSMQNISLQIWNSLPLRFKNDIKQYADQYKGEYPHIRRKFISSYSIFLKIIHKIDSLYHISDKKSFTPDDYLKNFGSFSIADYIRMNFLPKVKNFNCLNAVILSVIIDYYVEIILLIDRNYSYYPFLSAPFG